MADLVSNDLDLNKCAPAFVKTVEKTGQTVDFNGIYYAPTAAARESGRSFPGYRAETPKGGSYKVEMVCPAISQDGDKVRVYWRFPAVRGEEADAADDWDWSEIFDVEADA